MAMTDATSVEGERLLTLYIYANQTLVTASLKADVDAISEAQAIVRSLHTDWQHAKKKQVHTFKYKKLPAEAAFLYGEGLWGT